MTGTISNHVLALIAFIFLLLPFPLYGGVEGRLEALIEADNRYNKDLTYIEGWGDLLIKKREQASTYGLTFSSTYREEEWHGEIYQFYGERELKELSLLIKGGRFERSDQSGYYAIDGVYLKKGTGALSFSFYGGKLLRVESDKQLSAGSTGGMELTFRGDKAAKASPFFINLFVEMGYQQIYDEDKLSRLTWGLAKASAAEMKETGFWEFQTGGDFIMEDGTIETMSTAFGIKLLEKSFVRIAYNIYEPGDKDFSLRDRFYRLYAKGKEEVISGELFYFPMKRLDLYVTGKEVNHHMGQKGYGTRAGAMLRTKKGIDLNLEADYLYLDKEKAHTIFLSSKSSIDAKTKMKLTAIYQILDKRTTGENKGYGMDIAIDRMIDSDLFFSLYGMNIINSDYDDEYRIGTRLSLTFSEDKL
ncbi:MAG: hypothetical protein OEV42_02190 [Deltaproteobacteria bacterium]|nr:hypothetical protein [Deltaproteobacteria bacterium]